MMLVYNDCRYIDGDGVPLYVGNCEGPETLETQCPIIGCLLFRSSVFIDVVKFQKRWRRVHDYDFYRRVWKKYKVDHLPVCLYDYRTHAASMSGNHYAMTTEQAALLVSVAENSAQRRRAWGWCWEENAKQAVRDNRPWKSVFYGVRAAVSEPCRVPQAWSRLWRTAYQAIPVPIKCAWRTVKRRA